MSEPTAFDPRTWVMALFGGFVLGALPFSLLGLFWAPLGLIGLVAWPVVGSAILHAARTESDDREAAVGAER